LAACKARQVRHAPDVHLYDNANGGIADARFPAGYGASGAERSDRAALMTGARSSMAVLRWSAEGN
jgi:hypothetical protein